MNIYSIKEIVEATNNILSSKKNESTKSISKLKSTDTDKPLILKKEISTNYNHINQINYKIKIKSDVKNNMINELYLFLRKKVKKNTLKIIIDEQIEIKNLRNKINFLKQKKNELLSNFNLLEKKYILTVKNYERLKIDNIELLKQNKKLKIDNHEILNDLNKVNRKNNELNVQNDELKIHNDQLQNNLNKIIYENENFTKEKSELKNSLEETELNIQTINQKNRSLEINNSELKDTISRYIKNTKKIQEKLNYTENSKNLELNEINQKVKFYQDENVRLSSELLSIQRKNENIKINLSDIELEKAKISDKIKELSKSIDEKSNVVSTTFVKEKSESTASDIEKLNNKEQKSLDEVISRIFDKI